MAMLFCVVTPCRLVGRYQRFGETYCLNVEDGDSMFLRNVVMCPLVYTAPKLRTTTTTLANNVSFVFVTNVSHSCQIEHGQCIASTLRSDHVQRTENCSGMKNVIIGRVIFFILMLVATVWIQPGTLLNTRLVR
jgi:hypothetical protein